MHVFELGSNLYFKSNNFFLTNNSWSKQKKIVIIYVKVNYLIEPKKCTKKYEAILLENNWKIEM